MLEGQRVRPARLEALGFGWRFPTIDLAMADAVREQPEPERAARGPVS